MRVLFIGNSFTARNNLPELVWLLADAAEERFEHKLISQGGASLRMHWNKGLATGAIRSGRFDYVVLQEQSTLPVKNAKRMGENVGLFDPVIKESGAKTALYMTWARAHAPETQKAITDAYTSIAREMGATLIPAGSAWEKFLAEHEKPVLHDKDKSHPTLAGSFLAACAVFSALFDRACSDLEIEVRGLDGAEVKLLQRVADQVRA